MAAVVPQIWAAVNSILLINLENVVCHSTLPAEVGLPKENMLGSGATIGAAEKPPLNGLGAAAPPLGRPPAAPPAKGPAAARHPSGRPGEPLPDLRRQSMRSLFTARVQQCVGRLPSRHTFWRSCRGPFQTKQLSNPVPMLASGCI